MLENKITQADRSIFQEDIKNSFRNLKKNMNNLLSMKVEFLNLCN